jgi:hypothetical protein
VIFLEFVVAGAEARTSCRRASSPLGPYIDRDNNPATGSPPSGLTRFAVGTICRGIYDSYAGRAPLECTAP